MRYFIKTIGISGDRISIFEGKFPRMLLSQMCFKLRGGKVEVLKEGDKLVVYCIRRGVKEFPGGGFIAAQRVLSPVREEPGVFPRPWNYIVDIEPIKFCLRNEIRLAEVREWPNKSEKLKKALRIKLLARGGLLEIEAADYRMFIRAFG